MKTQLSPFAVLAILSGTPCAQAQATDFLEFRAYNATQEIPNTEVEYDQNQNHAGGIPPTFSADHKTLHSVGNRWSAYALPSPVEVLEDSVLQFTFTLNEETVDGFQAICVDEDTELTGPNGQCFALSTTQGWINNMLNVATLTAVGQTTHHSIPIGHFFTGTVNYMAFLQDSDGTNRTKGDSSISDLKLIQQGRNTLEVEIDGQKEYLENHQLSYTYKDGTQDTDDWLMSISEDGASVQINGNQWKALPLNTPYNITQTTVVEFDAVVSQTGDFHAICLDSDLDVAQGEKPCVSIMTPVDDLFHILTTELVAGETTKLVIPFGQIMGLLHGEEMEVNYLVFVQDDDKDDKRGGRSTFSNIRIYEEPRMPIHMSVFGQNITVPNIQDSFTMSSSSTYVQDSVDHIMSVSADGKTVTVPGNNYKRFKLDVPIEVTSSTMMKFDFSVPHEVENHFICLLGNTNNAKDGRDDCFAVSGRDAGSSSSGYKKMTPFTSEGESNSYDINIGSYFTGTVMYLALGQDNDKVYTPSKAEGESVWSNFELYALPSLSIGMDSGGTARSGAVSFTIENAQKSYHTSQDTTPVRDHLAVVSADGSSITAHGNMWRAFPLSPPKTAAELGDFVVSFDYILNEPAEFHYLCFEDNLKWADYDDPTDNELDPKRCLRLNHFQDVGNGIHLYEPKVGEPHRYVARLGTQFERFEAWNYLVIVQDNDEGDKSGGKMTVSNIEVFTDVTSCLKDTDPGYEFTVSSCTIDSVLAGVKAQMMTTCGVGANHDPLLELLAFWGVDTEIEVYSEIEHLCTSSYEDSEYDFAKTISSETQLVREFIDGGTILNYELDSEGGNLAKDGAGISFSNQKASSKILTMPKHHALDHCDVGAAMCCWVDSRGASALVDNSDVCYVNMKESKRTAHVADGYSIYGDGHAGALNCHGFAWGTDKGSSLDALKGNALFKVGFMDNLYSVLKGNVEQVPGAPMCGCVDRMPVVTNAACTKATDDTSTVKITYNASLQAFTSEYTLGSIDYSDCGDLNSYYKSLVGQDTPEADYIDTRLVGDGGCHVAINDFLSGKGLVKAPVQ